MAVFQLTRENVADYHTKGKQSKPLKADRALLTEWKTDADETVIRLAGEKDSSGAVVREGMIERCERGIKASKDPEISALLAGQLKDMQNELTTAQNMQTSSAAALALISAALISKGDSAHDTGGMSSYYAAKRARGAESSAPQQFKALDTPRIDRVEVDGVPLLTRLDQAIRGACAIKPDTFKTAADYHAAVRAELLADVVLWVNAADMIAADGDSATARQIKLTTEDAPLALLAKPASKPASASASKPASK